MTTTERHHPVTFRAVARLAPLLQAFIGCGEPAPRKDAGAEASRADGDYGRPAVLARNAGELRNFQGRRPLWIKVDPQTLGSRSFTVGMEDLPPGDSIGIHKHLTEDEIVFVHRGQVAITLGDSIARKQCHQVHRVDEGH